MTKIIAIIMLAFALLAATPPACNAAPLNAVATTSIIGDWVKIVAGDNVNLTVLVGSDGDPHEYQPVPADTLSLSNASLIFENGLSLEYWLDKIYTSSESTATRVVVSDGITVRHVPKNEGEQGAGQTDDRDPHAWQDVKDAIVMVSNIRDALVKADPSHAAEYNRRASDYIKQLGELDGWVKSQIDSIPPKFRKLVTSHDAFGYFGDRYGIDVSRSALESVTTEASDPSAEQIVEVLNRIKASGVPVIFVENVQNPKLIQQIASEANVKVGPPLYSDALGPPGSAGDTYIKMIRYNVQTLVKALTP